MRQLRMRLRSRRGETLVESMVSILIFTFSSILFLSMVSSAAKINRTAQEADAQYQAQQRVTEEGPDAPGAAVTDGTATITYNGTTLTESVKIVRQNGAEHSIYAYYPEN